MAIQVSSTNSELPIYCLCDKKGGPMVWCLHNKCCLCRDCIVKHLETTQTCPLCNEQFTLDDLKKAESINGLSMPNSSRFQCSNAERGCLALLEPNWTGAHLEYCEYTETTCRNNGCSATIIKKDLTSHESEVCEKREVKCSECGREMKHEVMNTHSCTLTKEVRALKIEMRALKTVVKGFTNKMDDLKTKFEETKMAMENQIMQQPACMFQERSDVMVLGGCDEKFRHTSVEVFDWSKGAWLLGQPMKERRSGATSFIYKQQLFVAGGKYRQGARDNIEVMAFCQLEEQQQWLEFGAKLMKGSWGHSSVVYGDRLIVIGGYDGATVSSAIYEVLLTHPYTKTCLCSMPEPIWNHSNQLIGDKIFIFGGMTGGENKDTVANVWQYDITRNILTRMVPLPYTVNGAATVTLRDSVIVLGGSDRDENRLKTVVKYDVVRGSCKSLPHMKNARDGCTAVITGNALVVMGGYHCSSVHGQEYLKSAEHFNFNNYEWTELPPMNTGRSYATAVVKPDFY